MLEQLRQSIGAAPELELLATFSSGQSALDWFEHQRCDVALVDIGLPDMSGVSVIGSITRRNIGCECLVISTFGDEETVLAAICAGAAGYLLKDPDPLDLASAVRTIQQGGSPMNALIARKVNQRLRKGNVEAVRGKDEQAVLSEREHEVLNLIARGYTYAEIAKLAGIALSTVQSHIKSIYRKLSVSSRSEAVFEAQHMGLLGG